MSDFQKEQLLYERLLGAYHDFPTTSNSYETTNNELHWESLNKVISALEKLGHNDYSEFTIVPKSVNWGSGITKYQVNISTLRMNMMSVLRMMGSQFGCGDPAYDLSRYATSSNIQMSQTASPNATASSNQNQSQKQEMSVTVSQELEKLQKIVDENLSEEQIEQVREPLEIFKQNPSIWRNAQKLIQISAGFSRDVAIQFIGSILSTLTLASMGITPTHN